MDASPLSRRTFLGAAAAAVLVGCGGRDEAVRRLDARLQPGPPMEPGNASSIVLLKTYELGDAEMIDVAFSPPGSLLVCSSDDGRVQALNLQAGGARPLGTDEGRVWAVAMTGDGRTLWGGEAEKVSESGAPDARDVGATVHDIAIDGSQRRIAVAAADGSVHLARGERWRRVEALEGAVLAVAWDPAGERIACAGHAGEGAVLDARSGRRLARLRYAAGDEGQDMNGISWIGAQAIATASQDGGVRLWSATGRPQRALAGREGWLRAVRLAPTGPLLADGGQAGTVRLSDVGSGRELATLPAGEGPVWGLEFSPAGRLLAAACSDGAVRVYGLRGGSA